MSADRRFFILSRFFSEIGLRDEANEVPGAEFSREQHFKMAERSEPAEMKASPTAGEVFPDGTAIELLRDPVGSEKLTLVRFRDGILDIKPTMPYANRVFAPMPVDASVAAAVRIPTHVAPPESTKQLYDDVYAVINSHLGQLDSCVTAMVFAAFASWLSPVLPMAPILAISTPPGSPKNVVLQLLRLLCRRTLCVAGVRRSNLFRVPMELRPTLVLDEPELQDTMQNILHASAHRGAYFPSNDGVRELYGPKIVVTSKPTHGLMTDTDVLRVALIPLSRQLAFLDKKAEERIAEDFQPRFLGYFLRNFNSVQIPDFDVSGLAVPIQALAHAFGAAMIGDPELQSKIVPLLKIQDEELRADRARTFESVVLEAFLSFIHEGGWSKVRTDNVAQRVAAIYKGRGSDQAPSPEAVGWAIRRLGIPSGRINRAGNGVELNVSVCRLIHKLAQAHGVRAMEGGLRTDCRHCQALLPTLAQATT
jgi:hypothetical protein